MYRVEAKKRCIVFWVKVLRMEDNRLVRMVLLTIEY